MNNQNNTELAAAGRQFRDLMSSDTALIEIAKMISNLADKLDVTTLALREACKERDALAAENSTIKTMNDCLAEELRGYESDGAFDGPDMHKLWHSHAGALPATDAAIVNIQAQGVEMFADDCESDVVFVEPEDTEHYELMAEHARKFAAELRKGAGV